MAKRSTFYEFRDISKNLVDYQTSIAVASEGILEEKKKLREIIKKVYFSGLHKKEEAFLNLKVSPNNGDYSVEKTVLDTIIDNINGEDSQIPDEFSLEINQMLIVITADEFNQNGFAYDSGRSTIYSVVDSVFEMISVTVSLKEFDYQDKNVFALMTKKAELDW